MRVAQDKLQSIKTGLHGAQGVCIFIVGCLALGVLTKDGGTGSAIGFLFGLCFLSIPALIYQIMVPMWSRASRFANVYAYTAIDLAFTIFWFAAFVAVAVWNNSGNQIKDEKDQKQASGTGTCGKFAHGSVAKCEVSRASAGFAFITCLLFAATSALSILNVIKHRRPGGIKQSRPKRLPMDETAKDIWNTNTDELDPSRQSEENPFDERHAYGQVSQIDLNCGGVSPINSSDDVRSVSAHPGRPLSYGSSTNLSIAPPTIYVETEAPSALSPNGYEQTPRGRFSFPNGNYNEAFR
ncbi:hypothetical protein LTR78_003690 [Recurvomyces mirabilis]|uniref:MARVEL domain-containing protein n=1 Tax=Recurvomyces mirabilis TaxID=574656 RepID=A0AAE0WRQ2_9PEZI|nr:hypothetical protein LTR78_003690 [Recurvomyces mirabilis]KAK5154802.1 hypothetical protein LTS14_006383 [Recurvomyces mirabilis]